MNDCVKNLENDMNYDQLIEKCNRLEETLDVILLSMNIGEGLPAELVTLLERKIDLAQRRQLRRIDKANAQSEYRTIKMRMADLESQFPDLVQEAFMNKNGYQVCSLQEALDFEKKRGYSYDKTIKEGEGYDKD